MEPQSINPSTSNNMDRCDQSVRSLRSNASSTKTHRRISVEVGSMFFTSPPNNCHEVECSKAPTSSAPRTFEYDRQYSNPRINNSRNEPATLECIGCPPELSIFSAPSPDREMIAFCPRFSKGNSETSHHIGSGTTSSEPNNDTDHQGTNDFIFTGPSTKTTSTTMRKDQIDNLDPTSRAIELIRQLSFDTPVPHQTSVSDKTGSDDHSPFQSTLHSQMESPDDFKHCLDAESLQHDDDEDEQQEEKDRPPSPPQIPLPPKINRIGDPNFLTVPSQILHNRNRTRSTSLSEMSDSCRAEFVDVEDDDSGNDGDGASVGSHSSSDFTISTGNENSDELVAVQNDVTLSNNDADEVEEEKEDQLTEPTSCILYTIDSESPGTMMVLPPPLVHQLSSFNRGRTSTMASDQSSFVSPATSEGDVFSDSRELDGEDQDEEFTHHLIGGCCNNDEFHGFDQPLFHDDVGCITLENDPDDQATRPRLDSETLRRWNEQCEGEALEKGITTKDQHIWRALSCPQDPNQVGDELMEGLELKKSESIIDEPHLMAKATLSHSIWSYSKASASPSTITSNHSDGDVMDMNMDLDFDISFSQSLDMSTSMSQEEDFGQNHHHVKGHHRKTHSFGSSHKNRRSVVPSMPTTTFIKGKNRHRRHKSDGSFFSKQRSSSNRENEASNSFLNEIDVMDHRRGKSLDFQHFHLLQSITEDGSKTQESTADDDSCAKIEELELDLLRINARSLLVTGLDKLKDGHWFGVGFGFAIGTIFGLLIPHLFNASSKVDECGHTTF